MANMGLKCRYRGIYLEIIKVQMVIQITRFLVCTVKKKRFVRLMKKNII